MATGLAPTASSSSSGGCCSCLRAFRRNQCDTALSGGSSSSSSTRGAPVSDGTAYSGAAAVKISSLPVPGGGADVGGSSSASNAAVPLFRFLRQEQKRLLEIDSSGLAETLRSYIDRVKASDLGVSQADVRRLRGRSGVGYQEVYSGPDMTICIFFLRAGSAIPLHNHPDMHVFGRFLFGRMRVISFDPERPVPVTCAQEGCSEAPSGCSKYCSLDCQEAADEAAFPSGIDVGATGMRSKRGLSPDSQALADGPASLQRRQPSGTLHGFPEGSCRASLHSDSILGPEAVTYGLAPDEGNVHQLEGIEDSAFLDVLFPPYDTWAGRDCTYFAREADDGNGRCILVPTYIPNFSTEALEYKGPSFFD